MLNLKSTKVARDTDLLTIGLLCGMLAAKSENLVELWFWLIVAAANVGTFLLKDTE